jgi:hypothetical protein
MEPVTFSAGQFPHFCVHNLDLVSTDAQSIIGATMRTLLPNDPQPLTAELRSMHIYRGKGVVDARHVPPSNEILGAWLVFKNVVVCSFLSYLF